MTDLTPDAAEVLRVHDAMQAPNAIFVFGSNLEGIHGAGAALYAARRYGARAGHPEGLCGQSYAIPTKRSPSTPMSLSAIARHVARFLRFAAAHPESQFIVTRVACGLAGYTEREIVPLFSDAPENCQLPGGWRGSKPTEQPSDPQGDT